MYDIIVVGAGPGGYIAAERAGAMGKKVLLIEKAELGGVCLNEGCIPTKTLLNSAKLYVHGHEAASFGVNITGIKYDLAKAMEWKSEVVKTLVNGIAGLMKKYKVEVIKGEAVFSAPKKVTVNNKEYEAENIIIGTGSSAFIPPVPGFDGKDIMTNREILNVRKLPGSLAIIGGGVIGLEFASYFSSLGTEVHVIEMMDEIVPFFDTDIARTLRDCMDKVEFLLSAKVEAIKNNNISYSLDGKKHSLKTDAILVATGRAPNVSGNGFETIGLDFSNKGIRVNEKMETNLPGVYAIGDVTGESLLAHSAYRMGEVAVNNICGYNDRMRYNAVPWVVYSIPEVAGVGMTEKEAKNKGIKIKKSVVPMRINGRFLAENGPAKGSCKVIFDKETDILLGVHMIGAHCSEMIFGAASMIETELRSKEIKEIIFPHPTVSEIIKDAVWYLK